MSHYTVRESTVTRVNVDVAMMPDGTISAEEISDAFQAAWSMRADRSTTSLRIDVSGIRFTIVDDFTVRFYFDVTEPTS